MGSSRRQRKFPHPEPEDEDVDDREWNDVLDEYLNPADYGEPNEEDDVIDDDEDSKNAYSVPDPRVFRRNYRKYRKFRMKEGKKFR